MASSPALPARSSCPWCAPGGGPADVDPLALCRPHLAEYEGETLDEMDRRDAQQYADRLGL